MMRQWSDTGGTALKAVHTSSRWRWRIGDQQLLLIMS
jgi:hypothetical protein